MLAARASSWHLFRPTVASVFLTAVAFAAAYLLRTGPAGIPGVVTLFLCAIIAVGTLFEGVQGFFAAFFFSLGVPFFFLPPYWDFEIEAESDRWLFRLFFLAAFGTAFLVSRVKIQVIRAEEKAQKADLLHRLSRSLAETDGRIEILSVSIDVMREVLPDRIEFYLPEGNVLAKVADGKLLPVDEHERTLPDWVFRNNEAAGRGTDVMNGAEALYLPLRSGDHVLGVLSVEFLDPRDFFSRERRALVETVGALIAAVLEREEHSTNGHRTELRIEGEKLRASLLRSLSHDLRTPLTGIGGAASVLLEQLSKGDTPENREHLKDIADEVAWLTRMIDNILSLTRFESDRIVLRKEAESVEDMVSSALQAASKRLQDHEVTVSLPDTFLLVPMESSLVEQVLVNLLDNAAKYSEPGTTVEVSVTADDTEAVFEVADRGKGIRPEDADKVFEKFQRGSGGQIKGVRGTGLGLSICKAIVEAHGGRITFFPRGGGGTRFRFTLPLEVASTNG